MVEVVNPSAVFLAERGSSEAVLVREVTRHLFWRNLIDPYAREWQNECGRWDLLDVVRATWALRPPDRQITTVSFFGSSSAIRSDISPMGICMVSVGTGANANKLIITGPVDTGTAGTNALTLTGTALSGTTPAGTTAGAGVGA